MVMIQVPRAYPSFDPSVHVAKVVGVAEAIRCVMIGADFGSRSPCVALHAALMPNHSMRVFREEFNSGIGLGRFLNDGAFGSVDAVDFVAAEAACVAKNTVNNISPRMELEGRGFRVLVCKSSPRWRHMAINARLNAGNGAGGIVVDPSCTNLIATLIGHRQALGKLGSHRTTTPKYQHCADALGYLVEGFARWVTVEQVACTGLAVDAKA